MSQVEHAQQIYTMLLAAMRQNNQKMPQGEELTNLAKGAMIYANAFQEVVIGKK